LHVTRSFSRRQRFNHASFLFQRWENLFSPSFAFPLKLPDEFGVDLINLRASVCARRSGRRCRLCRRYSAAAAAPALDIFLGRTRLQLRSAPSIVSTPLFLLVVFLALLVHGSTVIDRRRADAENITIPSPPRFLPYAKAEGELVLGASVVQMTHFLSSSSSFLHRRRRYRRMIGDPRQHSAHYLSLCLSLLPLTNCDHYLFISSYARGKKLNGDDAQIVSSSTTKRDPNTEKALVQKNRK